MPKKPHFEAFIEHLQKTVEYSRSTRTTYGSVTRRFLTFMYSKQTGISMEDLRKRVDLDNKLNQIKTGDITPDVVNEFVVHTQQENAIDSQVAIYYGLRNYLLFLEREYQNKTYDYYRQIDIHNIGKRKNEKIHNPLTPRRTLKSKRTPLTKEELDNLLEISKSNPRNYAILIITYYTGQRRDSIYHINHKQDIDRKKKEIQIYAKGKDGLPREYTVDINDEVLEAIDSYLKVREETKDGYVLDNWGRKLYHKDALFLNGEGERLTPISYHHMIKKYFHMMGITRQVSFHSLRHTAITHMDDDGMTMKQIMLQSGHTTTQSLERYIHPDRKENKSRVDKALGRKPLPPQPQPQPETIVTKEKPKQEDTTDSYISKGIQDTIRLKELELLISQQNLASKQADIELLKLKQNHTDSMYG